MKAVFSTRFKADLTEAESKYRDISDRLASELRERLAGQAREIIHCAQSILSVRLHRQRIAQW